MKKKWFSKAFFLPVMFAYSIAIGLVYTGCGTDGSGSESTHQKIYVTADSELIYRLDDMIGTGQVEYDGSVGTSFSTPLCLFVDTAGRIYVADDGNSLIYRMDDMSGTNQVEYNGDVGTQFTSCRSISMDAAGKIYVADENGLIYQMDDMSGTNQIEYDGSAGTLFGDVYSIFVH